METQCDCEVEMHKHYVFYLLLSSAPSFVRLFSPVSYTGCQNLWSNVNYSIFALYHCADVHNFPNRQKLVPVCWSAEVQTLVPPSLHAPLATV
jgi:hypothetical protein